MPSVNGLAVESFVIVEDGCAAAYDLVDGKVQFRFGSPIFPGLTLVYTERSLKRHIAQCTEALAQLRFHEASGLPTANQQRP